MLYVTTRNNVDTFTAQRVLTMKRGSDGGLFHPFRLPVYSAGEVRALAEKNFNVCVADTLNLLFGTRLTGYDIDLAVGRRAVRLQQLGQRLVMAELWHNPQWQFSGMVRDLACLVAGHRDQQPEISGWVNIGVRIAVLTGIFSELIREDLADPDRPVDISVLSGDFSGPISAWYARKMGLPVGNIICCCNENSTLWDFICHGQLKTDGVAVNTVIPEADVTVPDELERLIALYGGPEEVARYVETLRCAQTYYVDDLLLHRMRQGIYVTVSSEKRVLAAISNCCSTYGCLMSASSALTYTGLQDYRTRTGSARLALLVTEKSPRLDGRLIAECLDISEDDLADRF